MSRHNKRRTGEQECLFVCLFNKNQQEQEKKTGPQGIKMGSLALERTQTTGGLMLMIRLGMMRQIGTYKKLTRGNKYQVWLIRAL